LLLIGSPTQGGRPLAPVKDFLSSISAPALKTMKIVTFDTRLTAKWVRIFGYAAEKMAKEVAAKGGALLAPPEGFFVQGNTGPLKEGETDRAAEWAKKIAEGIRTPER
jgi:flavodoxin